MEKIRGYKCQRTGLTEGTLIYNNWLKNKGLYKKSCEDEFINWLYSSSGWYDKEISGSYFDIDVDAVRDSEVYKRFLTEYEKALKKSDVFHLMVHGEYHVDQSGLEEYAQVFGENYCYWKDVHYLRSFKGKTYVIGSIADLIEDQHKVCGIVTPEGYFNGRDMRDRNSFETIDRLWDQIDKTFDTYFVSCGPMGVFLVDRLCEIGKTALTIGSGIYDLYPVTGLKEKRPVGWEKIENGRYWSKK